MASNFTIVLFQRRHFGRIPNTFDGVEPNVPFAGQIKSFTFD